MSTQALILTVVAACLAIMRMIPVLTPLVSIIPARWQWVPSALAASVAALSTMDASNLSQSLEVLLGVIVLIVLAAQKGLHQ